MIVLMCCLCVLEKEFVMVIDGVYVMLGDLVVWFEVVLFMYLGCGVFVIDCVSFEVLFGSMVVLVGVLGVGKLMVVSLLLCFWDL